MTQHYIEIPPGERFIEVIWFAKQIAACLVDIPDTGPLLVDMKKKTPEPHPQYANHYREELLSNEDVDYLRRIKPASPFWSGGNMTQAEYAEFVEAFRNAPNRPAWELVPYFRDFKTEAKTERGQAFAKHVQQIQNRVHEGTLKLIDEHRAPTTTLTLNALISIKDARAYAEPLGIELHAMQEKWCYWSNAAYALAHRQTNEDESQARRLLKKLGHYLEPLGNSFPFPAPELTAEMLEKHPSLKDAPRDCNALLKLKMHRELTYATDLKKLDVAGKIAFYDPVTMRRIAKDEAADPIVMLDEIAQQLMELAARDADEKSATKESSEEPQGELVQAGELVQGKVPSLTKSAISAAFQDLHFDYKQWMDNLGDPRPWLVVCRTAKGDSKTSATWNPVLIATALIDKKTTGGRLITVKELDHVFVGLKEWQDKWQEASEYFRD